jgi:hypothetical protein
MDDDEKNNDPIENQEEKEEYVENDNIISLIKEGLIKQGIPLAVLFLIFILINLSSFINTVVGRFDRAVVDNNLTFKGYVIQGIILTSSFAIFNIFY